MKAIYSEQVSQIGIRDIPVPEVRDDEVLIHVAYAGVCGSDLHAFRGEHAFRKPPVMLGHELSGTVTQIGSAVKTVSIGDAVSVMPQIGCGACEYCNLGKTNLCTNKTLPGTARWMGSFCEYFTAPESVICKLGEVPLDLGAVLEPLAVACHVMERFPKDHGSDLVILGMGTIGLMLLILAPHYNFKNVLVTDILDYNLSIAKSLGAQATVNVRNAEAVEAVRATFGILGSENTIIAAGNQEILSQAIDMTKPGGTILYFAMITKMMTFNTYPIVFKEMNIKGSLNYTMSDFEKARAFLMAEKDSFKRLITQILPFEEAGKAFEILDKKTEDSIKILLANSDHPPA